jgi:hypothetical protein
VSATNLFYEISSFSGHFLTGSPRTIENKKPAEYPRQALGCWQVSKFVKCDPQLIARPQYRIRRNYPYKINYLAGWMRPWNRFNELSKDQIHSYTILWDCDLEVNLLMAFRVLRNFRNICSTLCHDERFIPDAAYLENKNQPSLHGGACRSSKAKKEPPRLAYRGGPRITLIMTIAG